MKSGYGIYLYKNGTKYEGECENDVMNGKGMINYKNGD